MHLNTAPDGGQSQMTTDKNNEAALVKRPAARKELGVSAPTWREFERKGLLPRPVLQGGGCAWYARADIDRLKAGTMGDKEGAA